MKAAGMAAKLIGGIRAYNIPYAVLACLSGIFLFYPAAIRLLPSLAAAAIAAWGGGNIFYDLQHMSEDSLRRPYRLFPSYPRAKALLASLAILLLGLSGVILSSIDLARGLLVWGLSIIIMPSYSWFKKRGLFAKFLVRGYAGFIYVFAPLFLLNRLDALAILLALSIFFLDVADNIASDVRDRKIDSASSPLARWDEATVRRGLLCALVLGSALLVSTAVMKVSPYTALLLVPVAILVCHTSAIQTEWTMHRAHTIRKTLLLSVFSLAHTQMLGFLGLISLPFVMWVYRLSYPPHQ